MRPTAAINSAPADAERWPSSAKASALLLSLEALARWREHVALTSEDDLPEPQGTSSVWIPLTILRSGSTRSRQPGHPSG